MLLLLLVGLTVPLVIEGAEVLGQSPEGAEGT